MNFGWIYLWFSMLVVCHASSFTQTVQWECSSDKLVMKGHDVNISQISNATCFGKVKFIEVFALNTLFIDDDFNATGQQVQLSLIAPIWVIDDERKILLNGKYGDEHESLYAPSGIGDFVNGRPGKPGISAGRLLGIAKKIIDGSKLEIHMNGGRGGAGQHGGTGIDGVNGEDPPIPDDSTLAISVFESTQFSYNVSMNETIAVENTTITITTMNIRVFGKPATKPGNGGHGGVGGMGGYAGNHFIVGIEDFAVFADPGDVGEAGIGGACGNAPRSGFNLDVFFRDEFNYTTDPPIITRGKPSPSVVHPVNKLSAGVNGSDGLNDKGIVYPDLADLINPSHAINDYKSFVRMHLAIDGKNLKLSEFVADINNNERIRSLYDTSGLIHEMLGIEKQYFELKKKISLTPHYNSLWKRAVEYARNFPESIEMIDAFRWFYTTITRRVNDDNSTSAILNLSEYVDEIEAQIGKLRHSEMEIDYIARQHFFNEEIQSVRSMIEKQILPNFQIILSEIGSNVKSLMDELYERQYKFVEPKQDPNATIPGLNITITIADEFIYPDDMMDSLMPFDKMFPFKVLNMVNDFTYTTMGESFEMIETTDEATGEAANYFFSDSLSEFTQSMEQISRNEKKKKLQLFTKQLNDIERELNQLTTFHIELNELLRTVREFKKELSQQISNESLSFSDVDLKRDKLISAVEQTQSELQFSEDLSTSLDVTLAILILREIPLYVYEQLSVEVITDMLNYYDIAKQMEEEAQNSYQENIYDTILKRFQEFEKSVNEISGCINKSTFLKVDKWRTLSAIRDIAPFFRKWSNETAIKEHLYRSIEKLDDSLTSLFEACDDIDHLSKTISINEFISPQKLQYSTNLSLYAAITNLKETIQINVVLDQYEAAVKALERYQFPFGNKVIRPDLDLPTNLQPNDSKRLAEVVIELVNYLKSEVKSAELSIGKYSHLVFSDIEFSYKSVVGPFYVWKYSEFGDELKRLLSGEEIELKADIAMVTALSAIKFNRIGMRIRSEKNIRPQGFITMRMMQSSDYRCDTKIHSFAVDDNLTYSHSLKWNDDGEPIMRNKVDRHLYGKNYFLSPYTTWKIKIESMSTELAHSFPIDLELYGHGEFIPSSQILSKICNELNTTSPLTMMD